MKALGRKGTATREAILESARKVFTESGYDAGVREIAENAGVTAMLVNRYFGSKEQLFEEVVDTVLSAPGILTRDTLRAAPDLAALCHDVAEALLARTTPGTTPMDGFLVLLRSSNNAQATAILRKKIDAHFARPLATLLPGADAAQRAAVFLAIISGIQLMRQIIDLPALRGATPGKLGKRLEALLAVAIAPDTEAPHTMG
ncbi:TetR/AcrR family transcriptional regulator [Cupriavidus plantarum]|uniref:TetR/AcrR family transcriptional regulator n=1 Tax=Cupriavidus plantarum TaxID=942865 RepID=UPI000E270733|nr:TetR/AcrR family transcriptional regulator [Cupriavidus plantarum]NYI02625.1 AcrR family transcriptional regulator [Cupriavidus plantarum]REE87558.1 TetR family transcriptional regulator [Cupriavidus plantarum]RLK29992.1 TetR family transcriptional regulator [Cupriavidus plantarum]CAG2144568.1 HTH-type transcriptional regulator BetI [Cupriavidus plantarum]SMR85926.1 transcriptional regulator, TetR family [Cupriavidus plantarum]